MGKVSEVAAKRALKMANGDRKAAYSQYIQLYYEQTGYLDCGINNKELQAFYDKKGW